MALNCSCCLLVKDFGIQWYVILMTQENVDDLLRLFCAMANQLFGTRALPKPLITCCKLDSKELRSLKFELQRKCFLSRKCLWMCWGVVGQQTCIFGLHLDCITVSLHSPYKETVIGLWKQWKLLSVMWAQQALQLRHSQAIFRSANYKRVMPFNMRPCLIHHWQSRYHVSMLEISSKCSKHSKLKNWISICCKIPCIIWKQAPDRNAVLVLFVHM